MCSFSISLRSDIILYCSFLHVNRDIFVQFYFYLLLQTSTYKFFSPFPQSPLNNSVCMKNKTNSHICNEIISFFFSKNSDKFYHFTIFFRFLSLSLKNSIYWSESCAIFFPSLFSLLLCIILLNFNSCLLFRLFFFLTD